MWRLLGAGRRRVPALLQEAALGFRRAGHHHGGRLPALWAQAANIHDAELHPVQQAWIEHQVPQCGYCQNGMMITAVNLLAKTPHPTVAEIKTAFSTSGPSAHLAGAAPTT